MATHNRNIYLDKLTPSAKNALKETADEISLRVLDKAFEIAQLKNTSELEISLRDILEAREQLLRLKIEQEHSAHSSKRISLIISLSGAIYALAGILLYMYQNNNFDIKSDLGLIISSIGILTMLIGFIYTQLIHKRNNSSETILVSNNLSESKADYDIVQRWQIIERLASNIMKENGFTENKSKSINSIIDFLSEHLGNADNTVKLRYLLKTRNRILHEFYQPTKAEKQDLMNFSNTVIERLEGMKK